MKAVYLPICLVSVVVLFSIMVVIMVVLVMMVVVVRDNNGTGNQPHLTQLGAGPY